MANLYSAAVTYTNAGAAGATLGANYKSGSGNGLGPKTHILEVGVGGGAISQAQLDGFLKGIAFGDTSAGTTESDAFTVAGVGAFTAGTSTAVYVAVQGSGTPSTTTGDYFTACTVAITATFDQIPA